MSQKRTEELFPKHEGLDLDSFQDERFQIHRLLGRGGMATVYEAFDNTLKEKVAIKVLHSQLREERLVARFRREATLTRKIAHPNVLKLFDVVFLQGNIAVTMELINGGSLFEFINKNQMIPVNEAVLIIKQIVSGLDAAHRLGILHRDLKPHNILMVQSREIKIADFGLAYSLYDTGQGLTLEGNVGGTPAYMSPEVIQGDFYDPRSDIYSLGIIAYELCTCQSPFTGSSVYQLFQKHLHSRPPHPRTVNNAVDPTLDDIIMTCLEKEPESRFQSTGELILALEEYTSPEQNKIILHDGEHIPGILLSENHTNKPGRGEQDRQKLCYSCGERVPIHFNNCPFCENKPLQSLGKGKWSVLLLPPRKESIWQKLKRDFRSENVTLYPGEIVNAVIVQLRRAGIGHGIANEKLVNGINHCPCVLLENLEENEADAFLEDLRALGVRAEKQKLSKSISLLSRRPLLSKMMQLASIGATVFSGVFFALFLNQFLTMYPLVNPTLYFLPFVAIAGFWGYAKLDTMPQQNLHTLFTDSLMQPTLPLKQLTEKQALDILPQLEDHSIRKIVVSMMNRAADLHEFTKTDNRIDLDQWIQHGLTLALTAQKARNERLLEENSKKSIAVETGRTYDPGELQAPKSHNEVTESAVTFQPQPLENLAEESSGDQSVSLDNETRALADLLRLRAHIDALAIRYQLQKSQLAIETTELDDLLSDIQTHTEAFIEVEKL